MDINAAMEAYCHSFGNRPEALQAYCDEQSQPEIASVLGARIDTLENSIFDIVWKQSEHQQVSAQQVAGIAREYLKANAPEVHETGFRAILRWVGWMAWHEGCLFSPDAD
jgi:hypothetical protein